MQTSGGGTDVSGLALILAQQLEQRREDEAAQLTALRCAGLSRLVCLCFQVGAAG